MSDRSEQLLCLSYYFSTDRILLYTKFLSKLSEFCTPLVWSFAVKEKNFPVHNENSKHFELIQGEDKIPHWLNLARHFSDYVWDNKLISSSRESMWRLRRAGNAKSHERLLWNAAKLGNGIKRSANLDKWVEGRMLKYGYCPRSLDTFQASRPAAVLAMVPFTPLHMSIVASARKLQIPTIAYITSWDNLTTKGRLTFDYDGYLVWSETMKQELLAFHPQSRNKPIVIVGAPQYDMFINEAFFESKEDFIERHGLDKNKKIILYCLGSPNFIREDYGAASFLDLLRADLPTNIQVIVRLHPGFYEDDYQIVPEIRRLYRDVVVQGNRQYFDKHPLQTDASVVEWVNTFRHADVVINLASTVTVDAAIFDKPIININFDPQPSEPDAQLIREINSRWNHFRPVAESGGVWNVRSSEELCEAMRTYLEQPELHRQGRQSIVEHVCGNVDGRAGEKMAAGIQEILSFARRTNGPTSGYKPALVSGRTFDHGRDRRITVD